MSDSESEASRRYEYVPSMAAAVIFIVLFGLSVLGHAFLIVKKKTWYFIAFLLGALFETAGYVGRALSSGEAPNYSLPPYILQALLLLLGPTLMAASIYMVLGRLIVLLHAENLSLIRPARITKIFVIGDVLSFFAQAAGGGMLSGADSSADVTRGNTVIIVGLAIQIAFFGFFIIVTILFHRRILGAPTRRSMEINAPWKFLLYALYMGSVMIMVRSIFRVAEYVEGEGGVLQSNEYWLYIFDATPMTITAATFIAMHPSRVVNKESLGFKQQGSVDLESTGEYSNNHNRHHSEQSYPLRGSM